MMEVEYDDEDYYDDVEWSFEEEADSDQQQEEVPLAISGDFVAECPYCGDVLDHVHDDLGFCRTCDRLLVFAVDATDPDDVPY